MTSNGLHPAWLYAVAVAATLLVGSALVILDCALWVGVVMLTGLSRAHHSRRAPVLVDAGRPTHARPAGLVGAPLGSAEACLPPCLRRGFAEPIEGARARIEGERRMVSGWHRRTASSLHQQVHARLIRRRGTDQSPRRGSRRLSGRAQACRSTRRAAHAGRKRRPCATGQPTACLYWAELHLVRLLPDPQGEREFIVRSRPVTPKRRRGRGRRRP